MKPVVIFGCGDFAQVAARYLCDDSDYDVVAYTVDDAHLTDTAMPGLEGVPFESVATHFPPSECEIFVAVGYSKINRARRTVTQRCRQRGYRFASYVSSRAHVHQPVELGENSFVFEANVVQPFVTIGDNVVMWSGNHIGHHSVIEEDCFIASHAVICGRVRIGRGSFIGVNATVIDGVTVGSENIIGAGSLITGDTEKNQVFRGARTMPASDTSDDLWG